MGSISKEQMRKFSNKDIAELAGFSVADVDGAFKNYNRLIDTLTERPGNSLADFLRVAETAGIPDIDETLGRALLDAGRLERSLGELAAVPGIGFATIRNLVPAMAALDVPASTAERAPSRAKRRRPITPRGLIDPVAQLGLIPALGSHLLGQTRSTILPDDIVDLFEELGEDINRIGDTVEEGRDLIEALREAVRKAREAAEILKGARPRSPALESAGGGTRTNPETPVEIDGEIEQDEYARMFGEALEAEDLYMVFIDRLMGFEVDGAGDDNVYATVESKVYLKNPDVKITSSFVTAVYNIDEREEYRLKPKLPVADRRDLPLDPDDWKIRGFLETRDAALALRVKGDVRGIPLSRLDKVEISFYLYESDSVEALTGAVAELGAATIAALGIIKGKFTAPAGSTAEAAAAIRRALQRLNELIARDVTLIEDQVTFTPQHFETAFRTGQTFAVRQRNTTAACGLPFQRVVGALTEDDDPLDTGSADALLQDNQSKLRDPDFYEDRFDSFYDLRLRFERLEASGSGS